MPFPGVNPRPVVPMNPKHMEDFIERTVRERRPLQQALDALLAKYNLIPSVEERSTLQRMIEILKEEIVLRRKKF